MPRPPRLISSTVEKRHTVPAKRRFATMAVLLLAIGALAGAPPAAAQQGYISCDTFGYVDTAPSEAGEPQRATVFCQVSGGGSLTFTPSAPQHGGLNRIVREPTLFSFTYTSAAAYRGPDPFEVVVTSDGGQDPVTVPFDVTVVAPVNDPPQCDMRFDGPPYMPGQARYRFPAGKSFRGTMGCKDDEEAPLAFSVLQPPVYGTISGLQAVASSTNYFFHNYPLPNSEGVFGFQTETGYSGHDDFSLRAFDGANCLNLTFSYVVGTARPNPNPTQVKSNGCSAAPVRAPVLSLRSNSAGTARVSSRGVFRLGKHEIVCSGAGPACSVKTSVTGDIPRRLLAKSLKIGKSSTKVRAGGRAKVKSKLTRRGRALLKRARKLRAKVKVTVRRGQATPVTRTLNVRLKAPKRRRSPSK